MHVELPPTEFADLVRPLLERVAGELATQLVKSAGALANDRVAGYMDKAQAAMYLGIEVRALENWMAPAGHSSSGRGAGRGLPYFKFGETVRFSKARIDAWALTLERNPVAMHGLEVAA